MPQESSQSIRVLHESDVGVAKRAAKGLAENLGFDPTAGEEIALAVIELATNLAKYAPGGQLTLTPLEEASRVGLEILSQDSGPGIPDVERALTNGYSTSGSRGMGLGAVNRLMDEFDIQSEPKAGTRVRCRKWRRDYAPGTERCPMEFGVATRPRTFGAPNGDAFIIRPWAQSVLAGIIDGLGHGQFAHRAAQTARQYVESHFDQPLDQVFRGTGRACRATRGVVMALARFDWGDGRVSVASVGNIETRVFPPSPGLDFPVRRGVVGLNAPRAVVTQRPWDPARILVMHSDGLRSHWTWKEFPDLPRQTASAAAESLLRGLARELDDATVIVVRKAPP
jgi:anti-sigma regulatory factor (Ser/Thr protein kinase)/serine/threonine protein phosphatase PrpC